MQLISNQIFFFQNNKITSDYIAAKKIVLKHENDDINLSELNFQAGKEINLT